MRYFMRRGASTRPIAGLVLCAALAALAALGVSLPRSALAENLGPGGGSRIITGDDVVGPYRVLFTSSPEPAQPGTLSLVVRVSDPASGEKIRDAAVQVELVHSADGTKVQGTLTHFDAGNPIDYAAHLQIDKAGMWNGTLQISGPSGPAQVIFAQRVLSARQTSTLFVIGLPFLVLLCGLGGFWILRSSKRAVNKP